MGSPTDEELMARFAQGDTQALEVLFDRHATGVHAFLTRMVRDPSAADDLLQTTFLSVVRSVDRYRRDAPVRPWLLTIAANAARDALRRRGPVRADGEVPLPAEEVVEPVTSDPGARRRIEAAFAELPPSQREAVLMHKVHGLTFEEIATALDISPTAARIRAHRGYEKLRELLGDLA